MYTQFITLYTETFSKFKFLWLKIHISECFLNTQASICTGYEIKLGPHSVITSNLFA